MKKLIAILKNDEGLSLSEVLIAVGLSGLIAIGCTQVALASFNSAKYVQTKAINTVNTATLNHSVVADLESASSFVVHSTNPANACTSKYTTGTVSSAVRPLFTINYADGSAVGYEVRQTSGDSALWKVNCGTSGVQNGSSMLLRRSLPAIQGETWDSAIKCVNYPAGGSITTFNCPTDQILDSISANAGFIFNVPGTLKDASSSYPAQVIVAARNVA